MANRIQLTTDGNRAYLEAVEDAWRFVALQARVFAQQRVGWEAQLAAVGEFLVVDAARRGAPEVRNAPLGGDKQVLFAVGLLLAAVILALLALILGAAHRAFRAIDDEQAQLRHLGEQPLQISGPPRWPVQFPA